uniref:Expressed protein n=2 Tax=Schizophyllum commune (strain H4-8 / FGSC 9210) TaxID=578458 RepID=D8PYU4_SCHCM
MLTVPQPPVHDDVDGCPSVTLQGDSVNGWRHVLDTLYDASFLSALHLRKLGDTLPIVSDVVRIATKYRFTGLRRECLAILGRHFPTSLDTVPQNPRNRPSLEQATAVINLAREIGGLSLLPFAYLICINAVDRDDPSIIYRDLPISFEDKAAALQGLHTVLNAQAEEMFPYAYEDAETATLGCSERCSTKEAFECFVEDSGYLHFFHGEPFDEFCIAHEFLCLRCRNHVNEVFAGGKWRIWKRLPEFFCLAENWEELIRLQDLDS